MFRIKNIPIFLQKCLCVSLEEKTDAIMNGKSTKNVEKTDISNLYNDITLFKRGEKKLYYHEFILKTGISTLFKFFIDIDVNKKVFDDDLKIKNTIEEILIFMKSTFEFKPVNENQNNFFDIIHDNIKITKSNNPTKTSFHIIFNNILVELDDFKKMRKQFKELKKMSKNILTTNIDINLFRENTQLRFIYSLKNDDAYFHEAFSNDISSEDNLCNYLFTFVDLDDLNKLSYYMSVKPREIKVYNNVDYKYTLEFPHILFLTGNLLCSNYIKS